MSNLPDFIIMSSIPQWFGYEAFTFAVAKQLYSSSVWETPDFDY